MDAWIATWIATGYSARRAGSPTNSDQLDYETRVFHMIKSCICTLTHSSWLRILAHRRSVALAAIFHVQCWAKHTMPNSQLVSQLLGRPCTPPLTTSFKRKTFENEHKTPKLDSAWTSLNNPYLALRVFMISGYTNEFARHVKVLETRICSTARLLRTTCCWFVVEGCGQDWYLGALWLW